MSLADRWVARLRHNARAVILGTAVVVALSIYLIWFHLPIIADFSALLPANAASVRDLHRIESRVVAQDTVLIVVESRDPAARSAAATAMADRARHMSNDLVSQVEDDDRELRDFLKAHRYLLVPLGDLESVRDALADKLRATKLHGNPLFVELDDPAPPPAGTGWNELRAKWHDASAKLDHSKFISDDGTLQLVIVRSAFTRTDAARGAALMAAIRRARDEVVSATPGVTVGLAGGVEVTRLEHDALVRGVVLSALITALLVPAVLVLFFRSARLFAILLGVTAIGTMAALGAAALTVGHLNAATAFLGAIVAGNGVNYGIFLIARYNAAREELAPEPAMARAVAGAIRPTMVASLGAVIAYGALATSAFKGFADFAIIGAAGMPLCWIATFVLVPILVLRFAPTPKSRGGELLARLQARLLGFRHPVIVCMAVGACFAGSVAIACRYATSDPFEYNLRELRAHDAAQDEAERWTRKSDAAFGKGISGATYIAADRSEQVPKIVAALRVLDRGKPPADQVIGDLHSILELVPPDQSQKLAVLAQIRTLLADPAIAQLDPDERAELDEVRPPDQIDAFGIDAVPPSVLGPLRERDGKVGLLVSVRPALALDDYRGKDLIKFASVVRRLELPGGEVVTTSGPSVVFADIIDAIGSDAPIVTLVAAIGLVVMVVFAGGGRRPAIATLVATAVGAVVLIAGCAVLGIRVNFLDFVALPITLGLGVDYAINVAHPPSGIVDAHQILLSAGASVFVCSLTTMIGYGSLLVSQNLAIRSFGVVSLLGEACTVMAALIVVPAILTLGHRSTIARRIADAA
jgi:hypothetical protein